MQSFLKNSNINIVLYGTTEAGEMKFKTTWIYFLRDVFATVVVVVIAELHPRAKRARGRSPIAKEMW